MCCSKGLLKRFVPFFATFAFGMLIASFFVSVAAPNFRFGRGLRQSEYHSCWRMENRKLREENFHLKQQATNDNIQQNSDLLENDVIQHNTDFSGDINELVPPPPPMPPVAPRRVR